MFVTRKRIISALALTLVTLLVGGACSKKKDDNDVTPEPSTSARVEAVADFQIVGAIEQAFSGQDPDVTIPDDVAGVTGPQTTPAATGANAPIGGVMRIRLEDVSQELADECGLASGDEVELFWTSDTRFVPADVVADSTQIEDELEGHVAGASGRVFRAASDDGSDALDDLDTPEPTATEEADLANASPFSIGTPQSSSDLGTPDEACILVADQVGLEGATPATSRPAVRRTASPARTASPKPTETPEASPEKTKKPTVSPTASATATQSPGPT